MKARISLLHRTEADWLKFKSWVPEAGECILYDPDEHYAYTRIKVGDGIRNLQDLDFIIESTIADVLGTFQEPKIIDAGRIIEYK